MTPKMRQPFIFPFIRQGLLIHEWKWSLGIGYALKGSLPWIFYRVCVSCSWLELNGKPRVGDFSSPSILINYCIILFFLKIQPQWELHVCCKAVALLAGQQCWCTSVSLIFFLFFFIGQLWINLPIMRSICDSNEDSILTSILNLGWQRCHHIARLIGYPNSNLAFRLGLR